MQVLPPALEDVIEAFGALPGVGPRTAERYAYYLIRHDNRAAQELARSLRELHNGVGYCQKTYALVSAGQLRSPLTSLRLRKRINIMGRIMYSAAWSRRLTELVPSNSISRN
jgi:recombination protein RecR